MMVTVTELDSAYGAPGDWHYRLIHPDGVIVLTREGDEWRLWQSRDWENLFGVLWHIWHGQPNGTRIQLYVDGLMDTNGIRTAERGARNQIVHADLLIDNKLHRSKDELFVHIAPLFKLTMRNAPELLPEWVPGSLRVGPPVWEDLL